MTTANIAVAGGAGTRLPPGLANLVAPLTVNQFLTEHWERKHLILHRNDPDYYADLFTLNDMDFLLDTCKVTSSDLRLVAEGKETPIIELVSTENGNYANAIEALYDRYRKGATVNLLFVQDYWTPLARLCRVLAEELSAQLHVNIYLTPAGTQALKPHYDTHDVFVAQIFGTKRWQIWAPQLELPLRTQPFGGVAKELGEPMEEFELAPGDLFYMPRGTLHAAAANDTGSLHLTIGANPVVWADVIRRTVERLTEKDPRFRRALSPGGGHDATLESSVVAHAETLLDALRQGLEAPAVAQEARRRALLAVKPSLSGHLLDLEHLPSVTIDTPIRRRGDIPWSIRTSDGLASVEFHGKQVQFPDRVAEQLEFIGRATTFTGRDLPGRLNDAGRLVLLQRLIREGFLTLVRPD
jgi:ribosomal protein L16 Arg81 hydroxylase